MPEVQMRVLEAYNDIRAHENDEDQQDPELTDPQLSFQLAQVVSDLEFRQVLLATRSEADRMRRLADFFPAYNLRQKQRQHARKVAPRNGHAKWPPGV
jgi:hypothetical protein